MPSLSRRHMLAAVGSAAAWLTAPGALAAPRSDLWPRWQAHDAASRHSVDHAAWDAFLARYRHEGADGVARVAYGAVSQADRQALADYLARLSATPVSSLNQAEQFSYWVNFYNALTVQIILDNYPVASIRDIDISPGLFANGPWGARLVTVEGEALSLDDIEHRILRPIWQDPRIHYVVNCAAIGCPNLPAQALRPSSNDATMNAAAITYVNDPRGIDVSPNGLTVSRIYDWFAEDFGDLRAHLARYATGDRAASLASGVAITRYRYDWALNDINSEGRPGN
ncbi:MAG: DUF547 domain-containing protein [Pseudomonadota bacterium]